MSPPALPLVASHFCYFCCDLVFIFIFPGEGGNDSLTRLWKFRSHKKASAVDLFLIFIYDFIYKQVHSRTSEWEATDAIYMTEAFILYMPNQ